MQTRVEDILRDKGDAIVRVSSGTSVLGAVWTMVDHKVGSVLVTAADGRVVGIFTERDHLRRVTLAGLDPARTTVESVMTPEVIGVAPTATVEECLALMTSKRCRHLPVFEGRELVGLVSMGDCAERLSRRARQTVADLVHYIEGTYPR